MGESLRMLGVPNDAPLDNVMQPTAADLIGEEV